MGPFHELASQSLRARHHDDPVRQQEMIFTTMATTTFPSARGTALSVHDCPSCGAPIPLRQEAIGESLLKLAAATTDILGYAIHGDCTPL